MMQREFNLKAKHAKIKQICLISFRFFDQYILGFSINTDYNA